MTATEYPTITVGKHENLVVRYSLAALILMSRRGVDPAQVHIVTAPTIKQPDGTIVANPDSALNVLKVFSSCVAENFIDLSRPYRVDLDTAPSADYWAVIADNMLPQIAEAVGHAMGKAMEERRKLLAAVPPMAAS